jgi:hypothetical protein
MEPTPREDVFRTYWRFAAERHRIFEARVNGQWEPQTEDPILYRFRFCNVFRAADRVSQHLIQHAAYGAEGLDEEDLFLRVVLHRLFCRISTWELLESRHGRIDAATFDPVSYDTVLEESRASGDKLYTAAYIVTPARSYGHKRKHRNHLALLEAMLDDGMAGRIARAPSLKSVYRELRAWPFIGPFMAYQLAIDLNYSPLISFSENSFTMPGPGARRGLAKVFSDLGHYSEQGAIHWLVDRQHDIATELGEDVPTLFGRPLHAIDCQNLLCEVDKYCRVAHPELTSDRKTIKQRFVANPKPFKFFFPPDWGVNSSIPQDWRADVHHSAPV